MRREARLLLSKATDSLILCIEHFNRPSDRGRASSVLIMLDHSFEMLLKASLVNRGGKIRERGARETIGFDACVRRALTDGSVQFLQDEEAVTLQTINGLRDAAYHHLIDVCEQHLYLQTQAGVTLFRDLLRRVFAHDLSALLPPRVLPVSTVAPTDLATLFDTEIAEIKKLLHPGRRRATEAYARLRPLAIFDATVRGEKLQPSGGELKRLGAALRKGTTWSDLFPGAASLEFTTEGAGPSISLRFTKREGIPIHVVPEGTPGAAVVGIKRVNELDFYNLGRDQVAAHIGLSGPKTTAVIQHLNLQDDADCYKEIIIGTSHFKRYSQTAILRIKKALELQPVDEVWREYNARRVSRRAP